MSHVEREILSALIDGELDSQERRLVHEHLQECAECRETLEEFTQVHGLVGELPRLVAPLEFLSDVLEPPRRRAPQKVAIVAFSGRRRWIALGAAAAAIAVSLAGLFVPEPSREPPVDAFIERHVSVHNGVEPGAQVLFGVGGR
jgi:anti-sigma factor RsiW